MVCARFHIATDGLTDRNQGSFVGGIAVIVFRMIVGRLGGKRVTGSVGEADDVLFANQSFRRDGQQPACL